MKKIIQIVLGVLIVSVSVYGIISNIEHIIYLNIHEYTYDFDNGYEIKQLEKTLTRLKTNIDYIEENKENILTTPEKTTAFDEMKTLYDEYLEVDFYKFDKILKRRDICDLTLEANKTGHLGVINVYRQAVSEDKEKVENFIFRYLQTMYAVDNNYRDYCYNYQYNSETLYSDVLYFGAGKVMGSFVTRVLLLEEASIEFMESGDINE